MTDIKKGEDQGEIVLNENGIPICSIHGKSLWIEETNIADNSAFCLGSDKTIYASAKLKLNKSHITTKNTPNELDHLVGGLHETKE